MTISFNSTLAAQLAAAFAKAHCEATRGPYRHDPDSDFIELSEEAERDLEYRALANCDCPATAAALTTLRNHARAASEQLAAAVEYVAKLERTIESGNEAFRQAREQWRARLAAVTALAREAVEIAAEDDAGFGWGGPSERSDRLAAIRRQLDEVSK